MTAALVRQSRSFFGFLLYNAADVTVVPSRQEVFGQTASEALACGTPVAAFAVGGLADIVDHRINGYLAQPFHTDDLANGIAWCLNGKESDSLRSAARKKAENTYGYDVVGRQYADLYKSLLTWRRNR